MSLRVNTIDTGQRTPPHGDPLMQAIANTELRCLLDNSSDAVRENLDNWLKENT